MSSGRRRKRRRIAPSSPGTGEPVKPRPAGTTPAKPRAVKPQAAAPAKPKAVPAKPKAATPKPPASKPKPPASTPKAAPARPKKPDAPAKPKDADALKPKVVADPLIGKTIGRCKIEERIGAGRTAVVYRAEYEALGQTVALKVLQPEIAAVPELVDRFKSEAQAIAKIDNENVLKIYDVGSEDEHHYMVVELLEGEEILDLIQREGQVDATDTLRIVRQAANGLAAAHGKGIIHRDVKPQNLFLLEDGTVKVVDFGLAAAYSDSNERVGTPHYMAPEVCESGNADLGSDVYALGIVMYHLLTGQPPYAGSSIQEIMRAHIAAKPLQPERTVKGLDPDVAELVRTLTKADPLARPASADILPLLDAIGGKELKEKTTLRGRRRRSRARAAVVRRERQGRKNMMPLVAGGAAVVVVALIVAMTSGSDNAKDDTKPGGRASTSSDGGGDGFTGEEPEDPALILARERMRQKAAEEREEREREAAGQEALVDAEKRARAVWRSDADTEAVLAYYRSVSRHHKKTAAAKAAKERIKEIKAGTRHPHPDRKFAAKDDVELARAALEKARPLLQEDIAKHDYRAAQRRLPGQVQDSSGRLARELIFLHSHTKRLIAFKSTLANGIQRHVAKKKDPLAIKIGGKTGTVVGATQKNFSVRGKDGKTTPVPWHELPAEKIAQVATTVLAGQGARVLLEQMAFAYAHVLEDAFWGAQLDIGNIDDTPQIKEIVGEYMNRYEKRAEGN